MAKLYLKAISGSMYEIARTNQTAEDITNGKVTGRVVIKL